MSQLPAIRLSQYAVEQVSTHASRIVPLARLQSPTLTAACMRTGMRTEIAVICGSLLASLVDDLVTASQLRKSDFERSKRMERILATTEEPALFALRLAMAASPTNGRACARHWDAICDKSETGKLAWLIGLDTDGAYRYGKKIEKRQLTRN